MIFPKLIFILNKLLIYKNLHQTSITSISDNIFHNSVKKMLAACQKNMYNLWVRKALISFIVLIIFFIYFIMENLHAVLYIKLGNN
ncbi:TPA: hypothetical protein JIZ22_02870 [Acinetobacter baumannii]|nr:hypothetical protein [Acinetobacter baumannii]HAV5010918.1 hypothetical protein [Acinetobacter baumannii]